MIVVYGLRVGTISGDRPEVVSKVFSDIKLTEALSCCQRLRNDGYINVVLSSEPGDMVGSMGVDSIVDGKTPDGYDYEWSKQHRGHPGLR
jgi:hypothetical protein